MWCGRCLLFAQAPASDLVVTAESHIGPHQPRHIVGPRPSTRWDCALGASGYWLLTPGVDGTMEFTPMNTTKRGWNGEREEGLVLA